MTDTKTDREIWEATTKGEWGTLNGRVVANGHTSLSAKDAEWIAYAHERWPKLINRIKRLESQLKQKKELWEKL